MIFSLPFASASARRSRPFAAFFAVLIALTILSASPARAVDIQTITSPGGIKALLVEDYTVPLIAVSMSFKGGATQEAIG
jgi:zinc protease